jgi:TolB-like protein
LALPVATQIAVAPFTGDKTTTDEQLQFMTGKFTSELIATKSFTVLERNKMDFILQEQGFQQSGACNSSECQVQMGQLLGVDYLVGGTLVNFGGEYAMHVDYLSVGTGQIIHSVDLSRKGDLQSVYMGICREAAGRLAAVVQGTTYTPVHEPPPLIASQPQVGMSTKRKIAMALWGSALVSGGAGVWFNQQGAGYAKDYDNALRNLTSSSGEQADADRLQSAYDDLKGAKLSRTVSYSVSLGSALIGTVLWFLPEGGK